MSKSISRLFLGLTAMFMALMVLSLHSAPAHAEDAQWYAQFWNNKDLSGAPVLTRYENSIDFHWGDGSPAPEVNDDNFSAQWTRTVYFPAGNYRFTATMDDAMRVWIDDSLVIDYWYDSQEHTATVDRNMSEGDHRIKVDYFEAGGVATAVFNWQKIGDSNSGAFYPNWKAEYFTNPTLSGAPALVRDDRYLSNNWGLGSPAPGIPADNFSVRWTRTFNVVPGTYNLLVTSDDGSRVFVNNELLMDNWHQQSATTKSAIVTSAGNTFTARVEYFEAHGDAFIDVKLVLVSQGGLPPTQPIFPGSCTQPTGYLATVTARTLNVRSGPSTLNEVTDVMRRCETATLTGYTNPTRDWVELVTPDGVLGWSSAQYLLLGVPTSQMNVK